MQWIRCLVVVAVTGILLSAPVSAQEFGACYDVTGGSWSAIDSTHTVSLPRPAAPDVSGDSVFYALPSRVQLALDLPYEGAPADVHLLVVPEDVLQVPHSQLTWWGGADSLEFGVSTGLVGTISRLSPSGSDWVGSAETFSDVAGILRYRRPIRLSRADCGTPPPVAASADRPLLRGFEFERIGPLKLGDALPNGVKALPRSSGAVTLQLRAAGLWAGADTVVARVGRRRGLQHLELRYPEGHDLSLAVGDLVRRYGPGEDPMGSGTLSWHNRTTTLFVSPTGRRPRVVALDPRGR